MVFTKSLRRIKEGNLRHIPFVFYTAIYSGVKDKELAISLERKAIGVMVAEVTLEYAGLQEKERPEVSQVLKPDRMDDVEEFLLKVKSIEDEISTFKLSQ